MKIVQDRTDQFAEIVTMIQHTRSEVVRLANASLIDLYWRVGRYISDKISVSEWGDGVVKQLADYIEKNSPEVKGFSDKNLWRMKQFYETYKDADEKLSPLVRQISWTNNLIIMSRSKSMDERAFYLTLCQKEHLSKRELNRQIDTALYERSMIGTPKISPMVREIAPQAEQIFRDQYVLEFIGGKDYEHENTMKKALIARMKDLVLEFGKDFLFIDEEYRLGSA
jgi:predicted nuclease of restriction endonuclease-like (RecB) superfamily